MNDHLKTKAELIEELKSLRKRLAEETPSERKQEETEVQQHKAFLELVLESLPYPFYVIDAQDYTIHLANSAAKSRTNEAMTTCYKMTHGRDEPCNKEEHPFPMEITVRTGKPAVVEHLHRDKHGDLYHVEVHSYPIFDSEGQVERVIEYSLDITERKQAELEIAESLLSAKQANQVKDEFIANISHEIRTPLNSIIGFSDLFRQRYGDLVSVRDKGIFDFITSSSNRLMHTVDSILNISQLAAGTIKIRQHELDLNTIVRAVLGEIMPQADEKGLDLTYTPTDQEAMVNVDNYSIHQAILNITENAIKYTNKGKIELSLIQKGDRFRLSIEDTGIGISEEYIKRIYDPYTQESEGFTKNFQGIGLGLALTKRYLELNGVEFELESQKNVGTTFTLCFPKCKGD